VITSIELMNLGGPFDISGKRDALTALEEQTLVPDFWQDSDKAQNLMQKVTDLKELLKRFSAVENSFSDAQVLWDLAVEEDDDELGKETKVHLADFKRQLEALEMAVLLSGSYDRNSAIISLHSGAGGVESQDWTGMLLRMYTRYCEKHNYKVETIDFQDGDEAGIKSVTLSIKGKNAYGYLKSERGVHRLVRISPFDAAGRRHTSFASVEVLPQVENSDDVKIKDDDLRIDTYRASGAGGQHVNKTDSAVRITHLPTGIVVQCQDERSQLSNKEKALQLLSAKLLDLKLREQEKELLELRGEQQEIGWGSQIRSYIFQPYRLVKDHRTNVEVGNIDAVMDGDLDDFIAAYLKKFSIKK
jgi:peptide chain release factor 2